MAITIKVNAPLDLETVRALYLDADYGKAVEDDDRLQAMIDHTPLVLSAFDGQQLVGMARCLTDFEYCCYLSDLLVLPTYQHRGIGTQLMATLEAYIGPRVSLSLRADDDAVAFYQQLGLPAADNMFRIHREA